MAHLLFKDTFCFDVNDKSVPRFISFYAFVLPLLFIWFIGYSYYTQSSLYILHNRLDKKAANAAKYKEEI